MWIERVRRHPTLAGCLGLALVELTGCETEAAAELEREMVAAEERLRAAHAGRPPREIELLQPARRLYRAIGIDPTRHRPSPEALVRRVLRGEPLPRIHPIVDLGNLWAVSSGLPVGLYDTARLRGETIEVRLGRPGESYPGIRKAEVRLGGRLVLADAEGPFGNPTSDSARTAVGPRTRDVLCVMLAPAATSPSLLDRWAAWLRERAAAYLAATAVSAVIPAEPGP